MTGMCCGCGRNINHRRTSSCSFIINQLVVHVHAMLSSSCTHCKLRNFDLSPWSIWCHRHSNHLLKVVAKRGRGAALKRTTRSSLRWCGTVLAARARTVIESRWGVRKRRVHHDPLADWPPHNVWFVGKHWPHWMSNLVIRTQRRVRHRVNDLTVCLPRVDSTSKHHLGRPPFSMRM